MKHYIVIVIPILFSVFDILTGLFAALKNHKFKSSKMREGLWHKVGIISLLALSIGLELAQKVMELGITIPIFTGVCVFVVLMEAGSIVENICKLNSNFIPEKIKSLLGLNKEEK